MKRNFSLLLLAVALPLLVGGCISDNSTREVEDALSAVADAWQNKDIEKYLAGWTDNGLKETFDVTREEAKEFLKESIGDQLYVFRAISNVNVTGESATAEAQIAEGLLLKPSRFSLIKQSGAWKIDREEHLSPAIPSGVTVVDLKLTEFAFVYDPALITNGNVAFRVENVGKQPHEVALVKVPADLDVQQALRSPEPPPGIEDVGFILLQHTGDTMNMVFTQTLAPGRYLMVCFLPDTEGDGQPHALKGMWAEFVIR